MAYQSTSPLFRSLSDAEEETFRQHARVTDPPNLDHWTVYHPVCREEWTLRGLGPDAVPRPGTWAAEVLADASGQWTGNGLRFRTRAEAQAYADDLFSRWTAVRETRAVQTPDPVTHAWVGRLLTMPPAALDPTCDHDDPAAPSFGQPCPGPGA